MKSTGFYHCDTCNNLAVLVSTGKALLHCCNEPMEQLSAKETGSGQEEHVPVLSVSNNRLKVAIGAVEHPMTQEHYIQWIALQEGNHMESVRLRPGDKPEAEFSYHPFDEQQELFVGENDEIVPNCEGNPCNFVLTEQPAARSVVYAYCNQHGLWKAEI